MKILYIHPETNDVAIVHLMPRKQVARFNPQVANLNETAYILWHANQSVPKGVPYKVVKDDFIVDRAFRNALTMDMDYDKDKCVEITKNRLRLERAPLLAQSDADFIRALEENDKKKEAAVRAEKKRLRDITLLAHEGLTLAELKALKCSQ